MRRLLVRFLAAVLLAVAVLAVDTAGPLPAAHALCAANSLDGDWHNTNPATRSATRIVVETCASKTTCSGGVCQVVNDCCTFVHPYGACSPTACDWGRQEAQSMGDGWIRSIYHYSWATKHVWAKTYVYYGVTYLRLWIYTDFTTADGRADYTTDEWMIR